MAICLLNFCIALLLIQANKVAFVFISRAFIILHSKLLPFGMSFNEVTNAFQKPKKMKPEMLQSIEINQTVANEMEFWIETNQSNDIYLIFCKVNFACCGESVLYNIG